MGGLREDAWAKPSSHQQGQQPMSLVMTCRLKCWRNTRENTAKRNLNIAFTIRAEDDSHQAHPFRLVCDNPCLVSTLITLHSHLSLPSSCLIKLTSHSYLRRVILCSGGDRLQHVGFLSALPCPQNTQVWGPRSRPSSGGLQAACQALDMNTPPQWEVCDIHLWKDLLLSPCFGGTCLIRCNQTVQCQFLINDL